MVAQAGLVRLAKSPLPFCHCSETAGGGLWVPLPKSLLPVWVLPQAAEAEVRSARDLLPRRTPQPSSYGTTPSEPRAQGAHDYFSSSFASQSPHTWAMSLKATWPRGYPAEEVQCPEQPHHCPSVTLGRLFHLPACLCPPVPSAHLSVCVWYLPTALQVPQEHHSLQTLRFSPHPSPILASRMTAGTTRIFLESPCARTK